MPTLILCLALFLFLLALFTFYLLVKTYLSKISCQNNQEKAWKDLRKKRLF